MDWIIYVSGMCVGVGATLTYQYIMRTKTPNKHTNESETQS